MNSDKPGTPEWVTCVRREAPGPSTSARGDTWCGRKAPMDFCFVGIDHAAQARRNGDRLIVCPDCRAKIVAALEST